MDRETINKILNKKKVIESRFCKNRISPHHKVAPGEVVYLKVSGGNIVASFEIERVLFFDNLNQKTISKIKEDYNSFIDASDNYWDKKRDSCYGTLIYIKNPKEIEPIKIYKRDRRAFVTSENIKEFLKHKNVSRS